MFDFEKKNPTIESAFRTDLAGLRGIAILLVAVFHIWFGRVSGGVDVFLAISGYFFVGSICKNIINKKPLSSLNPLPRINKLLKRLLPAMIVVLTFIYLFSSIEAMYPKSKKEEIGNQVIASIGYYQNWYLAKTSADYLAADSSRSPMQHLWSMSVQGQFFLGMFLIICLFGCLVKLIDKMFDLNSYQIKIIVISFLSIIIILSFIYGTYMNKKDYAWAYYDTFARIWEPLLAGIFSLIIFQKPLPKLLRNIFAWVGLILIFICGIITNGAHDFPGPLTLIPVGATILVILSISRNPQNGKYYNNDSGVVNQFLESKPLVKLGEISYSLYLWHWPILIFYLSYRNRNHVGKAGIFIIGLALVCAWLSTNYIENPLRYGKFTKKPTKAATSFKDKLLQPVSQSVIATLLVACVVLVGTKIVDWKKYLDSLNVNTDGIPSLNYPGAQALLADWRVPENIPLVPDPKVSDRDVPITTIQNCISGFEDGGVPSCEYGDLNANRVLVVAGGSHAEHWLPVLINLANDHHFKIKTYLKMGCPLTTDKTYKHGSQLYTECTDWVPKVMQEIENTHPDFVFTTDTRPNPHARGDDVPQGYLNIFNEFRDHNTRVIGMRDTPWPHDGNGKEIITRDCLSDPKNTQEDCSSNRKDMLNEKNPFDEVAADYPNMRSIDMTNGICDQQLCYSVVGNILVYRDQHHLSSAIVLSMRPQLEKIIGEETTWW